MRIFARIFLPLFTIYTLTLPARAYAIVPLVLAAARITSIALKTPAGQQLIAAPLGIGIAITAMQITRTDGTNSRTDDIYTTNSPRPPSAIEAAAGFKASATNPSPDPPSALSPTANAFWYCRDGSICTQSAASVSQCAFVAGAGFPYVMGAVGPAPNYAFSLTCNNASGAVVWSGVLNGSATTTCPAGYTLQGSTCALTNAAVVIKPSDGACPIVRAGNSYSVDATDPDCSNGQAPLFTTDATGVTHSLNDSFGSNFKFHINGDGSSSIVSEVTDSATNTTKRRTVTAAPPASASVPPVVTGVRDETIAGTGSQAGAVPSTGSVTSDPALAAAVAANTAAVNDLKNEISATGEAAMVTGGAVSAAATLATEFANQASDVTKRADGFGLPSLPAFLFPHFAPATCTPLVWNALGHQVTFDLCPYVPAIKSIESWILYVLTAFASFSMLMNFRAMRLRA